MPDEYSGSSVSVAVFRSSTLHSNRDLRLRERSHALERVLQRPHRDELDRDEHRSQRVQWLQWVALREHGVQCRQYLQQRLFVLQQSLPRDSGHVTIIDG